MIGIIDYGMGNLKSVSNALDSLNIKSIISDDKKVLKSCQKLILPGVGAFNDAMESLKKNSLDKFILEEVGRGKSLLGICLGMQLLFEEGYEGEKMEGLRLLKGKIVKMSGDGRRIPHIGWNNGKKYKEDKLLKGINDGSYFYYVHSYIVSEYSKEDLLMGADYKGILIPGLFRKKNIIGAQFHPEKSGEIGLKFLKNFSKGD